MMNFVINIFQICIAAKWSIRIGTSMLGTAQTEKDTVPALKQERESNRQVTQKENAESKRGYFYIPKVILLATSSLIFQTARLMLWTQLTPYDLLLPLPWPVEKTQLSMQENSPSDSREHLFPPTVVGTPTNFNPVCPGMSNYFLVTRLESDTGAVGAVTCSGTQFLCIFT